MSATGLIRLVVSLKSRKDSAFQLDVLDQRFMDLLDQEKDIARKQPESLHLRIGKFSDTMMRMPNLLKFRTMSSCDLPRTRHSSARTGGPWFASRPSTCIEEVVLKFLVYIHERQRHRDLGRVQRDFPVGI
jgi:hypothetical protein